jgi:hypothetical protein
MPLFETLCRGEQFLQTCCHVSEKIYNSVAPRLWDPFQKTPTVPKASFAGLEVIRFREYLLIDEEQMEAWNWPTQPLCGHDGAMEARSGRSEQH